MPKRIESTIVGVDWLTGTAKPGEAGLALRDRFKAVVDANKGVWTQGKTWHHMGGYSGVRYQQLAYGEGKQGSIIVITGDLANDLFYQFIDLVKPTRIDLAVTIKLGIPENIALQVWAELQALPNNRKRQYHYIHGNDDGGTIYVGARSSTQYGRVYDKGVESKSALPGHVWRYEIEFKAEAAEAVKRALTGRKDNVASAINALVYKWFDDRGVVPYFSRVNYDIQLAIAARVKDRDTSIDWLKRCVTPTIDRLRAEGVTQDDLTLILGLNPERY